MSGGERRRLIETMLWEAERGIDLLDEHAQRLAAGLARCGVSAEDIPDKAQLLQAVETRLSASTEYPRTRVRMVYDPCHAADCLDRAEFRIEEAQPRNISRVGIIEFAGAKYSCKWEDRRIFSDLHRRFPGFDEIILTRGGLITDGSWTNIYWIPDNLGSARPLTPALPLLRGTRRARLLALGQLVPADLSWPQLRRRGGLIGFINALNPPGSLNEIPVTDIIELAPSEPTAH
jgi:branched-subunit amino acid aminotransferase/4-amino-4-deoxychorismate lyase